MRFRIDLKIFLFAIIFVLTKQIHIYMLMMIFAFLHELGHLTAGILLKMKPEKLEIIPVGVTIRFKVDIKDINKKIGKTNLFELKKIFVALAGPLTNLIIIGIVANIPIKMVQQLEIIYANIFIFLFNMLPIYPLDGGRIVKGLIKIKKGNLKANHDTNIISIIITIIVTILANIILYYNFNIAIIFIILYIWILVLKENKIAKQKEKIYQILEQKY